MIWIFANWTSQDELRAVVRHEAAHLAFARTHTARGVSRPCRPVRGLRARIRARVVGGRNARSSERSVSMRSWRRSSARADPTELEPFQALKRTDARDYAGVMPVTCPVCRAENPEGSRFCNGCGSRLPDRVGARRGAQGHHGAVLRSRSGSPRRPSRADPEDVDRMLTRYFAMARRQIEAHGGVVEKFIGDAVVGVFGVPQAHEDDPERAVRAALRICDGGREPARHRRHAAAPAHRDQHRRGACPPRSSPRLPASASWPATPSTPRLGSSRSRRRWASPSARRPTRRPSAASSTRSCRRRR